MSAKENTSSRGFTLIELLVAIAIIAVVFGVIITSSSAIKKSSRDTTRKSDLGGIQTALEQYHADLHYYPTAVTPGNQLASPTHVYLDPIPSDPSLSATTNYLYTPGPSGCDNAAQNCLTYSICAVLESPAVGSTLTCPANNAYNYSVSSQ